MSRIEVEVGARRLGTKANRLMLVDVVSRIGCRVRNKAAKTDNKRGREHENEERKKKVVKGELTTVTSAGEGESKGGSVLVSPLFLLCWRQRAGETSGNAARRGRGR